MGCGGSARQVEQAALPNHIPSPQSQVTQVKPADQYRCGGCQSLFSIPPEVAVNGGTVACPTCKQHNNIPGRSQPSLATSQPPAPRNTSGATASTPSSNSLGASQSRCGSCKQVFSANAAPGSIVACPFCKAHNQLPAQLSSPQVSTTQVSPPPPPPPPAENNETKAILCGGCSKELQVKIVPNRALMEFKCPYCQASNRVDLTPQREDAPPTELPDWWKEKPAYGSYSLSNLSRSQIDVLQQLVDSTWKATVTRDRTDGKLGKLQVVFAQQNANPKLWANYVRAREEIRAKGVSTQVEAKTTAALRDIEGSSTLGSLDADVNECLLFHGTKPGICEEICKGDFKVLLTGLNKGALFGPGIYFGENSSKSDEYAPAGTDGIYKGLHAMLLTRVTCGNLKVVEDKVPDSNAILDECTGEHPKYDGVLGDREKARGTYREFVVYKNDQAYPEYVIIYRREDV